MRINGGGYAPWRLHGAETPGEAAARTRAQWCEQTQDLAPVSTMDWRVQVVYRFAVSPERWGPVAAQLMRGLLGGQDVLRDAGNAAHWTLGETSLYALLSEHPGALPARAGATCGLTLCQDGCRFGVWHDGRPDWGVPDLPFGGLCHAILAALQGGCIDDITSADAQWLGERLPAFVRRHPALATRAWEHVMAGMIDADGVAAPNGPGPVRALAQSAALLGAAGIAGYVLSDLPMWGIVVSTSLEAAAMARAIVALPRGGDVHARARYAAALALALPMLTCAEIGALVVRFMGVHAQLDFFHLTSAIRRRLESRSPGQTPGEVIAGLNARDFVRAAAHNAGRAFRLQPCTAAQALDALLALMHQHGAFALSGGVEHVAAAHRQLQLRRWAHTCDQWDADDRARANAVRQLTAAPYPTHAPHVPTTRSAAAPLPPPSAPPPVNSGDVAQPLLGGAARLVGAGASLATLCGHWPTRKRQVVAGGALLPVAALAGVVAYRKVFGETPMGPSGEALLGGDDPGHASPAGDAQRADPSDGSDLADRSEPRFDARDVLSLDQVLTLYESGEAVRDALRDLTFYERQTVTYTRALMERVLGDRTTLGYARDEALPWDAIVEVRYREQGFHFQGHGANAQLVTPETFSLAQIALGHHFRKEYLKLGGSREVTSVSSRDTRAERLLAAVDNDAFRQALHDSDVAAVQTLERSREVASAHAQLARAVFVSTLYRAIAERAIGCGADRFLLEQDDQAMAARTQLITFRHHVIADLAAYVVREGELAVLISIKRGDYFVWRPSTEDTQAFKSFMRDHMSMVDASKLDSPIFWEQRKFRIAAASAGDTVPARAAQHGANVTPARASTIDALYEALLPYPDFRFIVPEHLDDLMWSARVRHIRLNIDVHIVTESWRKLRHWDQVRLSAFDGLKVMAIAICGVLVRSFGWKAELVYGASAASMMGAGYGVLSQRSAGADLTELRSIHRQMLFANAMRMFFRRPDNQSLSDAVNVLLTHLSDVPPVYALVDRILDPSVVPDGAREELTHLATALTQFSRHSGVPDTPWRVLSRFRTDLRIGGDGAQRPPLREGQDNVHDFLGPACMPVESEAQLMRVPAGYLIAFADTRGRMLFAGVTCGAGRIAGACTDDSIATLPNGGFGMVGGAAHDSALKFTGNGCVESDGRAFQVFIEPLKDLIPVILIGTPTRAAAIDSTRAGASSVRPPPSKPAPSAPTTRRPTPDFNEPTYETLRQRAFARWAYFVDRWKAGYVFGTQPCSGEPVITPPAASPADEAPELDIRQRIEAPWSDARFRTSLVRTLARIEAGLLFWYLPRVPQVHQTLIRERLAGATELSVVEVSGCRIAGVVALRGAFDHLLVSLVTGEALLLGTRLDVPGNPALQAFLAPHVTRFDAERLKNVLSDTAQGSAPASALRMTFARRGHEDVAGGLRQWLLSEVGLAGELTGLPRRPASDMLYPIAYAARDLPPRQGERLLADVRRACATAAHPLPRPGTCHYDTLAQSGYCMGLPFAHFLGESIEDFVMGTSTPLSAQHDSQWLVDFAGDYIARVWACYVPHIAHRDAAHLVRSGLGNHAFGAALLDAAAYEGSGHFGPVLPSIWRGIPTGGRVCERRDLRLSSGVEIMSLDALRNVPSGYRVFVVEADEHRILEPVHIMSLGDGLAAMHHIDDDGAVQSTAYYCVDLARGNAPIRFRDRRWWLNGAIPVRLWAERGTPGIFAEIPAPPASDATLDTADILRALLNDKQIGAAIQQNVAMGHWALTGAERHVLGKIEGILTQFGVTSIRYRIVLAWSRPTQLRPSMSFAVIGRTSRPQGDTDGDRNLVVDLFASRVLGAQEGVSTAGNVLGEHAWAQMYVARAGNQCVKYRTAIHADLAVDLALEYQSEPGVSPYDERGDGTLLHAPDWAHFPQPGWHPDDQ